jgi:hypothetical protein
VTVLALLKDRVQTLKLPEVELAPQAVALKVQVASAVLPDKRSVGIGRLRCRS